MLDPIEGIVRALRRGARRVAILGGGFLGLEAVDGFLRRKCKVTIIEEGPRLPPLLL